jgi:hypothetical protein
MVVKHLFVALASVVAIVATSGSVSAQGAIIAPKFVGGNSNGFRGPFPGFFQSPKPLATNIQGAAPTVLYSVNSAQGIVQPASYLGANLGQTQSTTYQAIVSSNALLSLQSNTGQQGSIGSQGIQGGQIGQVGQVGGIGGGIGGIGGGIGGKGGGGGIIGGVGALGSRDYGF